MDRDMLEIKDLLSRGQMKIDLDMFDHKSQLRIVHYDDPLLEQSLRHHQRELTN